MQVSNRRINELVLLTFSDTINLDFDFDFDLPAGQYNFVARETDTLQIPPLILVVATPQSRRLSYSVVCKTETFLERIQKGKTLDVLGYFEIRDANDLLFCYGAIRFRKGMWSSEITPDPIPYKKPATEQYVDDSVKDALQEAKDYTDTLGTTIAGAVKSKPQLQFSDDGEEWGNEQLLTTKYFRWRNTISVDSQWSDPIFISSITKDYVNEQDEATLEDANGYTDSKFGAVESLFFYMLTSTSATDGTVSLNVKPTGAGTLIPAWGGNLTTELRQVYGFTYTSANESRLIPNSPFTIHIPYRSLQTNRTYNARYVVTAQHATLNGGAAFTVFDVTRNGTTPGNATYDVEFNAVNNQTTELVLPVGTVLTFSIYASVSSATGTMSILVNDSSDTMLIARADRVGQTSATSIITNVTGTQQSQESYNTYVYNALGTYEDVLDYLINGGV